MKLNVGRLKVETYRHFEDNVSEATALKRLQSKFGPKTVNISNINQWYDNFRRADSSFVDLRPYVYCELNEFLKTESGYVDTFALLKHLSDICIGGRYMFSTDYYSLLINDLFFSKSQQIDFDFSFMAIQSSTATSNNSFRVFIILPINLNTLIVDFGKYDQSYHKERYLGIGRIDFVHSIITIGNVKQMDVINRSYDIVGRSYSSNKSIVLLELSSNHLNDTSYQKITIEKSGDFELSTPIYLSNDFVDVFLYGDYICSFNALRSHPYNFQTLYRYSIAGETTKMTTTNSEITHQDGFLTPGHHLVCVGSTLFTVGSLIDQNQKRIFSFDLEILEWRRANLEFNCEDLDLHSDGMNTLIVTAKYKAEEYTVYRYKINQPDSLLDCAWIAIKRRSEFDRQVLDYAESKLPKNSRQRCLIRQ